MRTFLYLLFFSFAGLKGVSQSQYFLYIQTDNRQPFYVRIDEKIYSSSLTGFLIIGKLQDSQYEISLGFPKSVYPEQRFRIQMNKKDKGFQLKQFPEKGWGLVNLQTQAVVMNTAVIAKDPDLSGEKKTDDFSVMLSRVVNDSAILYTPVKPQVTQTAASQAAAEKKPAKKAPVTAITTTSVAKEEQVIASKDDNTTVTNAPALKETKEDSTDVNYKLKEITQSTARSNPAVTQAVENKAVLDKPFISRIEEQQTAGVYRATYLAQYNYNTDTIDILIPSETAVAIVKKEEPVIKQPAVTGDIIKDNSNADSSQSIVLEMGNVTDTFKIRKKIVMINSDCKNFATDHDVDKLRVKLLGDKNIEDRLITARKYYRTKCFTVQQIRALTELFPTDENKYRFLDLSYAFASDSGNYYLLEEVITDDYYKKRFQAMVRK